VWYLPPEKRTAPSPPTTSFQTTYHAYTSKNPTKQSATMKGINTAILSMAAALFCGHANAIPTAPAKLLERASKAEYVSAILQIFRQIVKGSKLAFDEKTNAW
jgi:hypothetical protein